MDFTRAFGKKRITRLNFSTRSNVNYFHDIIFLFSYLHDATFTVKEIRIIKGTLTIPVERVCWEYWTRLYKVKEDRIPGCRSLLTVSGIRSAQWSRQRLPPCVEITSIFIGERQYLHDKPHLVIYSRAQKATLQLLGGEGLFDITLKDEEMPQYGPPNQAL